MQDILHPLCSVHLHFTTYYNAQGVVERLIQHVVQQIAASASKTT